MCCLCSSGLPFGDTVVVKHGPRHFGTWDGTVRHFGQDSSALRSELSLGHFGTSADLSGQFGPTKLVPKYPGSEVSVIHLLTFQRLIYLSFNQLPIVVAQVLPSASGASVLGTKVRSTHHTNFLCDELTVACDELTDCRSARHNAVKPYSHLVTRFFGVTR